MLEPSSPQKQSPLQGAQDFHKTLQRNFQELFYRNPDLNPDQAYYLQACRMHVDCLQLTKEIARATSEIRQLKSLLKIQNTEPKPQRQSQRNKTDERSSEIKKRNRRTAGEIARHYICSVATCAKSYGSEGSLHQHMKLKHKIHEMFM